MNTDRLLVGLMAGLILPFLMVLLMYSIRFNYLPFSEFIYQSLVLKVHFKILSIAVFFSNLGLFYLFLKFKKNNAVRGVILSVIIYFFTMLLL